MYGATKLASDKIFIAANNIVGNQNTTFSVVRHGNVLGSRGSVVPLFQKLVNNKKNLTVTDKRMTRFWITLNEGVNFVANSFKRMRGGEIFVPIIPSVRIIDLAKVMSPNKKIKFTGIRPGEKLHELMCPNETYDLTFKFKDHFVILPSLKKNKLRSSFTNALGEKSIKVKADFEYSSDKNPHFLSNKEIKKYNKDFFYKNDL